MPFYSRPQLKRLNKSCFFVTPLQPPTIKTFKQTNVVIKIISNDCPLLKPPKLTLTVALTQLVMLNFTLTI